jgi:PIN domain nuclease of toxin-antitoxin system
MPADVLQKAEEVVQREAFSVVSLDLAVHHAMRDVSREQVPDPFDRIIAATALDAGAAAGTARLRHAGERQRGRVV